MSNLITPSTLQGFMELNPQNQVVFNRIKRALEDTYRLYGFFPLDTPVLEKSEILLAKAGGETEKQIYRFNKGDTDITMRFDLTVPLAKYVALHYNEISFPFKRFQIGKVYRGEKAQRGRFREFYQADIDIIGNNELNILNDAEIPSIIYTAFMKLGLDDFTIRINNRRLLNGLFEILGVNDKAADILHEIDRFDKIGRENVLSQLTDVVGLSVETAGSILDTLCFSGSNVETLNMLKGFCGKSEKFDTGLQELTDVLVYIGKFGVPESFYRVDLTIARGLDYYTGTVYETTFNRHPEIGSICSGGRYDNLAEYYTKQKLPGVGMSIGLTRLFFILCDKEYLNKSVSYPTDVLIVPMMDDMTYAAEVSAKLRLAGIGTQVYVEKKKTKAKLDYANKLSIPFVVFLGEDEVNSGKLTVKDMRSGEQLQAPVEDIIAHISSNLNSGSDEKLILVPEA